MGKLVVVGVGLIGGSFALAQKRSGAVTQVVGVGRGRGNLDAALRRGIVDRAFTLDGRLDRRAQPMPSWCCSPPRSGRCPHCSRPSPLRWVRTRWSPMPAAPRRTSWRRRARRWARRCRASCRPTRSPAREHAGALAAFDALFRDKQVVLTPLAETSPDALAQVTAAWTRCGAQVRALDPQRHDAIFAAVSHLPHVLAFALVARLAARPDAEACFELAGSGFRDFTRMRQQPGGDVARRRAWPIARRCAATSPRIATSSATSITRWPPPMARRCWACSSAHAPRATRWLLRETGGDEV